ncbi:hypothetical protein [Xenorhabdus lircayensis]|uniref:Uncharacterized protein n=1 Tax=Xenorhabdus lircayensis TaxID=2763499 RepID=A0ABS0U074_9GAMM|nr:hypothetical protein [Xenorhabdus lircayensis]MBI6547244.1 hypothetical protein [Xenorhabdus lircayensis]
MRKWPPVRIQKGINARKSDSAKNHCSGLPDKRSHTVAPERPVHPPTEENRHGNPTDFYPCHPAPAA